MVILIRGGPQEFKTVELGAANFFLKFYELGTGVKGVPIFSGARDGSE